MHLFKFCQSHLKWHQMCAHHQTALSGQCTFLWFFLRILNATKVFPYTIQFTVLMFMMFLNMTTQTMICGSVWNHWIMLWRLTKNTLTVGSPPPRKPSLLALTVLWQYLSCPILFQDSSSFIRDGCECLNAQDNMLCSSAQTISITVVTIQHHPPHFKVP